MVNLGTCHRKNKAVRGAVEKVPLILYNVTIVVTRFQCRNYVGHPETLIGGYK